MVDIYIQDIVSATPFINGGVSVILQIGNTLYQYITKPNIGNDELLWMLDSEWDHEKDKRSVFYWRGGNIER